MKSNFVGLLLKDFALEEETMGSAEEQLNLLLRSFEADG